MSLHCLALLGNKNEPLYLCSPSTDVDVEKSPHDDSALDDDHDVFGFLEDMAESSSERKTRKPSIRLETMIHASLDRLEEILGAPRKGISYGKFKRGSHWLGCICPIEEFEIYGYTTSSDVKILALIEREGIVPLKKRKEIDIKILFTAVHDCYVKYTMNPFTKIRGKIEPPCSEFEEGILAAMQQYNDAVAATKMVTI
ncbi:Sedlin [Nitzschia inconspicua]|uniref:Sedlin n=1 Tax=Nitzschia inconspicua TaxID=303405 RepID=A0A9K3LAT9_9STRA|nr:Sedlin [Nitzschia inconspicua]